MASSAPSRSRGSRHAPVVEDSLVRFDKPLDTKHKKVKSDLEVVLSNVILANEMIDAHDPSDPVEDNEAIQDVVGGIKSMEKKL